MQDTRAPHFQEAVRAADEQGFASVLRLAGGRAAVFHEETLAFARTIPDTDPAARTFARFDEMASLLADALRSLSVDARVGAVPREYCPGDYSVNARGRKKLIGIGQRLVRSAAHVGGVIVSNGADRVRDVLIPVYRHLDLEWDPTTVGSVFDETQSSPEDVFAAVRGIFDDRFNLQEATLEKETLALAETLEAEHSLAVTVR